jgi:hypothetical protein
MVATSNDEDDIQDAAYALALARDLAEELPKVFPPTTSFEHTRLFHKGLSAQNVLVDCHGSLTAIVDWECVYTVPEWRAYGIPGFLQSKVRETEPDRKNYQPKSGIDLQGMWLGDDLDNDGMCALYWKHLLEFQLTQLCEFWRVEESQWQCHLLDSSKWNTLELDFEKAVHNCDNFWTIQCVRRWLDCYRKGRKYSLADDLLA